MRDMALLSDYGNYAGNIVSGEVDIVNAIPIGTHLHQLRYNAYRGYKGLLKELAVVQVNGFTFVIDGRHRARANLDDRRTIVRARVKVSDCKDLEHFLLSISHFFLDEIPIID